MKNLLAGVIIMLAVALTGCGDSDNELTEVETCGYGGETIKVLSNSEATVQKEGELFFLYFGQGISTGSANLMETIYLLLPCNLPAKYKEDGARVRVSGEEKDNPAFSSHTNYTDFYILKIAKD